MAKKRAQRKRVPNPAVAKQRPAKPKPPSTLAPYATVGRDLGSLVGFGDVGERVGGAIGRLFGRGDYRVHMNSLMESYGAPAAGPPPPMTFRDGKRGVRVVEREYLGDVTSGTLSGGATLFKNDVYAINPADPTTFPWLSRIARQFDQWEPHGIVFEYRSTSSEYNGTTQALGTIILSTDYDPLDAAYASKAEAENSDYAMSVKSSDCAVHGIECDLRERPTQVLYTRGPEATVDRRFTDLGTFQLCSQGMSVAGVTLGELWVAYDITLYKKQLTDPGASGTYSRYLTSATAGSTSDHFGMNDASFEEWGNSDMEVQTDGVLLPSTAAVGSCFMFSWKVWGDGNGAVRPTFVYVGCTLDTRTSTTPSHALNGTGWIGDGTTEGASGWITNLFVRVTAPPTSGVSPAIRVATATFPVSVLGNSISVVEIDPDTLPTR